MSDHTRVTRLFLSPTRSPWAWSRRPRWDTVDHRQRDRPDVRSTDQDEAESYGHQACYGEPRPGFQLSRPRM